MATERNLDYLLIIWRRHHGGGIHRRLALVDTIRVEMEAVQLIRHLLKVLVHRKFLGIHRTRFHRRGMTVAVQGEGIEHGVSQVGDGIPRRCSFSAAAGAE